MPQVLLTRLSLLNSYANFFRDLGAPVDRELERFALPTATNLDRQSFVPVLNTGQFVRSMTHKECIDDIVYRVMRGQKIGNLSVNRSANGIHAPSLYVRLQRYFEFVHQENPSFEFSVHHLGALSRIIVHVAPKLREETLHYSDWTLVMQLVSVVREFCGSDWTPQEITFQPKFSICKDGLQEFRNTRLLFGRPETSIMFSKALLASGMPGHTLQDAAVESSIANSCGSSEPPFDYPTSLKLALYAYLGEGKLDVNVAAEIAGTSVRTLQRRLGQHGMSFSDLLQQARIEMASDLLTNSDSRIIDIAYSVGYEDPSNFARAFRRVSGVSPREFRDLEHMSGAAQ